MMGKNKATINNKNKTKDDVCSLIGINNDKNNKVKNILNPRGFLRWIVLLKKYLPSFVIDNRNADTALPITVLFLGVFVIFVWYVSW